MTIQNPILLAGLRLLLAAEARSQDKSKDKLPKQGQFYTGGLSMLRDFFGFIVKKQSEQIVFKKKKSV